MNWRKRLELALIEFMMDPEDIVYPMIQPGGTLEDMIMDC